MVVGVAVGGGGWVRWVVLVGVMLVGLGLVALNPSDENPSAIFFCGFHARRGAGGAACRFPLPMQQKQSTALLQKRGFWWGFWEKENPHPPNEPIEIARRVIG